MVKFLTSWPWSETKLKPLALAIYEITVYLLREWPFETVVVVGALSLWYWITSARKKASNAKARRLKALDRMTNKRSAVWAFAFFLIVLFVGSYFKWDNARRSANASPIQKTAEKTAQQLAEEAWSKKHPGK